jgi:hypothetical protein
LLLASVVATLRKFYPVTSVAGGSSFFVSADEVTSLDSGPAGSGAAAGVSAGGALSSFGAAGSPLLAFALRSLASDDPGSFKIRTN